VQHLRRGLRPPGRRLRLRLQPVRLPWLLRAPKLLRTSTQAGHMVALAACAHATITALIEPPPWWAMSKQASILSVGIGAGDQPRRGHTSAPPCNVHLYLACRVQGGGRRGSSQPDSRCGEGFFWDHWVHGGGCGNVWPSICLRMLGKSGGVIIHLCIACSHR
jgi:hypothetical protein